MVDNIAFKSKLSQAYKMEKTVISILEKQLKHAQQFPQMHGAMRKMLSDARHQATKTKRYIEMLKKNYIPQ